MSQVVTILVVLHILLSVIYAMDFRYDKDNVQGAMLRFVVSIFIPVFGFAFMLFSDYLQHRLEKVAGRELEDFFSQTTELELLNPLNVADEINKVPMVDALQMKDYSMRRKAVVETLKGDNALEYIDVLKEALLNEDTETSHYASSVIMDMQGKMQNSLFKKEVEFNKYPGNMENTYAYEEELYKAITSGIYEKSDLNKYYVKYKVLSDYALRFGESKEQLYHHRIFIDFATEDMVHAEAMCRKYWLLFPSSEEMVIDFIKLYIYKKDKEGLDEFLKELKNMPVHLTSKSLQYIRFFERVKG